MLVTFMADVCMWKMYMSLGVKVYSVLLVCLVSFTVIYYRM